MFLHHQYLHDMWTEMDLSGSPLLWYLIIGYFRILYIASITREVRATGRRSFSVLVLLFLEMGITVECFCSWGTVMLSIEVWNKIWNTSPSCWAQCLRTRPIILSGPGELLSLVLLRALTTSFVLKINAELSRLSLDRIISYYAGWSYLTRIWCKRS